MLLSCQKCSSFLHIKVRVHSFAGDFLQKNNSKLQSLNRFRFSFAFNVKISSNISEILNFQKITVKEDIVRIVTTE